MTENQIVEVKDIREKCIEKVEVLNKVKKLFLIPEMEVMTTKMVADYYEVGFEAIQSCYNRNKEEIQEDGAIKRKISDFNDSFKMKDSFTKSKTGISFNVDNHIVNIPNCGILCFSQRAILRIGMLLRDSEVAKEVRTQLLNTFENSSIEQRVEKIDEEIEFQAKIGKAYFSGNLEEFAKLSMEYNAFQNRYKTKLENENIKLTQINKELKTTNDLLARKAVEWGYKPILNALVRRYALECFGGKYRFPKAWSALYRQVKYKLGIDIESRNTADKLIDRIKDKEMPDVISVAVGLCESNNIDVGKVINEINAENIKKYK